MTFIDMIIQLAVIVGFGIWAYSKVTHKSINDVIIEIREMILKMKNNG